VFVLGAALVYVAQAPPRNSPIKMLFVHLRRVPPRPPPASADRKQRCRRRADAERERIGMAGTAQARPNDGPPRLVAAGCVRRRRQTPSQRRCGASCTVGPRSCRAPRAARFVGKNQPSASSPGASCGEGYPRPPRRRVPPRRWRFSADTGRRRHHWPRLSKRPRRLHRNDDGSLRD
jgi:hypothetical protein